MKKYFIQLNTNLGFKTYTYNAPNKKCAINNATMKFKSENRNQLSVVYMATADEIM